jgi:hypothetical protein
MSPKKWRSATVRYCASVGKVSEKKPPQRSAGAN